MAIDPQGRTVLITGANRGIGLAYAKAFLDAGVAKLYATARKPEELKPLVDEHGDKVVPLALDLSDEASVNAAAQTASDVDIVVNNGGVLAKGDAFGDKVFDNLDFEIDVNVKGLIRIARAFAPVLKANGGGALVQLNSIASLRNFAPFTTYSASKAASYSITQGLHDQLAKQGTDVVSVHPGPIGTDMGDDAGFEDAPPPSVVADATIEALKSGAFHCFPDQMAKEMWQAYEGFGSNVVEPAMQEA
jgi:NAD(P)-dependent dehydrogenase (short-subunit alcohol dehydrogenase family)